MYIAPMNRDCSGYLFAGHKPLLLQIFYKQQKGRIKSSGNKSGTKTKDAPQVTVLPKIDAIITINAENETAKHPPRCR